MSRPKVPILIILTKHDVLFLQQIEKLKFCQQIELLNLYKEHILY